MNLTNPPRARRRTASGRNGGLTLRDRLDAVRTSGEDGLSLVEVVVAMVVFAVMAAAALGVVVRTTGVASANASRVAAANLATMQIEAARSQLAIQLPDGTTTRTETVGGTTYTISQTASYTTQDTTTNLCAGSAGKLAHKLVTVTVTWPGMGNIRPVRADTVRALGVGDEGLDEATGALAVGVKNATGDPVGGVTVTLSPGGTTFTTGPDGCAVFVGLAAAAGGTDYTASVNQVGYVGQLNTQAVSVVQGVTRGTVSVTSLSYEPSRTLTVATSQPSGYTPVNGIPIGIRSSFTSSGRVLPTCGTGTACATGLPGQVRNIYPATYDVWAGNCTTHPRPSGTFSTVDASPAGATTTVPLGGLRVRRTSTALLVPDGSTVRVTTQSAGGCTAGQTYDLPALASGNSRGALPPGTYTVRVTNALNVVVFTKTDVVITAGGQEEVTP
ncbi:hypothetical protein GCM10028777_24130 [Angustibacter speluncae]